MNSKCGHPSQFYYCWKQQLRTPVKASLSLTRLSLQFYQTFSRCKYNGQQQPEPSAVFVQSVQWLRLCQNQENSLTKWRPGKPMRATQPLPRRYMAYMLPHDLRPSHFFASGIVEVMLFAVVS